MQSQIESERLLSEFRAQKKRAEELESRNKMLSDRLSESEKMLARLQGVGEGSSRVASRPSTNFGETATVDPLMDRYSNEYRKSMAGEPLSRGVDRSKLPSNGNISASQSTQGDEAAEPVWRPIDR